MHGASEQRGVAQGGSSLAPPPRPSASDAAVTAAGADGAAPAPATQRVEQPLLLRQQPDAALPADLVEPVQHRRVRRARGEPHQRLDHVPPVLAATPGCAAAANHSAARSRSPRCSARFPSISAYTPSAGPPSRAVQRRVGAPRSRPVRRPATATAAARSAPRPPPPPARPGPAPAHRAEHPTAVSRIAQLGQRRRRRRPCVDRVGVPARPGGRPRPGWPGPAPAAAAPPHSAASRSTAASRRRAAARSPTRISCQARLFWATAMSRVRPCAGGQRRAPPRPAPGPRRARRSAMSSAPSTVRASSSPVTSPACRNAASAVRAVGSSLGARAVLGGEPGHPERRPGAQDRVGVGGTRVGQQPAQPLPAGDVRARGTATSGAAAPPGAARCAGRRSAAWASAELMSLLTSSSRCTAAVRRAPARSGAVRATSRASTSACRRRIAASSPGAGGLLGGEVANRVEQPEPERPGAAHAQQAEFHEPVQQRDRVDHHRAVRSASSASISSASSTDQRLPNTASRRSARPLVRREQPIAGRHRVPQGPAAAAGRRPAHRPGRPDPVYRRPTAWPGRAPGRRTGRAAR